MPFYWFLVTFELYFPFAPIGANPLAAYGNFHHIAKEGAASRFWRPKDQRLKSVEYLKGSI